MTFPIYTIIYKAPNIKGAIQGQLTLLFYIAIIIYLVSCCLKHLNGVFIIYNAHVKFSHEVTTQNI